MAYKNNKNNKRKSNINKDSKTLLNNKKDVKQEKISGDVSQKSYYPDYSQNLSLISRLRTGQPGSIVKVRHFEVGAVDVGNLDYLKSQITSSINTLATQRGYQSTVTFSTVEDYVDKLINLEIAAATFVRTQNLVKVEDILGNSVGEAFYTISKDYFTDPNRFYNTNAFAVDAVNLKAAFAEAVSNHAYSTEFVSPMSKLLTTQHLHSQILAYFGVVHADIESNDDSVYNVLWNQHPAVTFAALKSLISNIKSVILSYPDLELILRSIGFSSFEEIGEEFQRDRIQQSMTIRNDGFFNAMLHNSKVDIEIVRASESTPAALVYTTNNTYPDTFLNDVSSTLTVMDPAATGVSAINKIAYTTLKMFSTGMVYRNFNIMAKSSLDAINMLVLKPFTAITRWRLAPEVMHATGGFNTGKVSAQFLNNLFTDFRDNDIRIPDNETQEAYLQFNAASSPDPAFISLTVREVPESVKALNEGGNRLTVSDALDATLYLDNRKVFLLYGTVE